MISDNMNQNQINEEESFIDNIKSDSGAFYRYAKKFSKSNNGIGPLKDVDGNICSDDTDMARILLNQYRSVFSVPVQEIQEQRKYSVEDMPDIFFNEENIMKYIKKLNASSSSGPDGVPSKCYKYGGIMICDALIDIYNQMWSEGYSPEKSRQAWISPTWKGSDKLIPSSYRPIALTNHFSKIFESIIREKILNHLTLNNLYDSAQHGSQSNKSTTSQLLEQMDTILEMLSNGTNVDIIFLDYAKAYDKVDQKLLLSKMYNMGIRGKNLKIISHWLCDRVQRVKVGSSLSEWDPVISGIP